MVSHGQYAGPRKTIGTANNTIFDTSEPISPKANDRLVQREELPSSRFASQEEENAASVQVAQVATRQESIGKHTDLELPPGCRFLSMTMDDPTLCRSVPLHKALRRLGANFASNQGGEMEVGVSEQTSEIDDFISHDWQTGRWSKLCSMLIVYNGRLAIFASNLVAILLSALQTDAVGLLPRDFVVQHTEQDSYEITTGVWCGAVSCPIFLLFLCFGHNIALLFSRGAGQRRVFVDKLCICQTNEELKTKGIRALAGILKQSRRLVILWSPRYLRRLWCVYELTSWMHYQTNHQPKPIRFEPVAWGRMLLGAWAIGYCVYLFCMIGFMFEEDRLEGPGRTALMFLIGPILFVLPTHYLRLVVEELVLVPEQLANFHVESSECFCCSVRHIHPETGLSITCDRDLIHETLIKWADSQPSVPRGSDGMTLAQSLRYFDCTVNTRLKYWAEKSAGVAAFPYESGMFVSAPFFWWCADYMAGYLSKNSTALVVDILLQFTALVFMCVPVTYKLVVLCLLILGRRCPTENYSWVSNGLVTLTVTVAWVVVCAGSFMLIEFLRRRGNHVVYILAYFAYGLVTVAVFNIDRLLICVQRFTSIPLDTE